MKYMGSKKTMLGNGLGELLRKEVPNHSRFVDLFCGSGAVAWFVARESARPVLAIDTQEYGVALARAVIGRTKPARSSELVCSFIDAARNACRHDPNWLEARRLDSQGLGVASYVGLARALCVLVAQSGPVVRAYGGHYFSPSQAIAVDSMMKALPPRGVNRDICLAALLIAASDCAAAPGHTAQPFQPTRTAGMYIQESWRRDIFSYAEKALVELSSAYAHVKGMARVGDAVIASADLDQDDLAFLDPPYAGVHYSRFYHVLETVACGNCGEVSGAGRYPPPRERPVSSFSRRGKSREAFDCLMRNLAARRCSAVVTFPAGECSNGLSGMLVARLAAKYFIIEKKKVESRFSTLGGNNAHRMARIEVNELIMLLHPRNGAVAPQLRPVKRKRIGRSSADACDRRASIRKADETRGGHTMEFVRLPRRASVNKFWEPSGHI